MGAIAERRDYQRFAPVATFQCPSRAKRRPAILGVWVSENRPAPWPRKLNFAPSRCGLSLRECMPWFALAPCQPLAWCFRANRCKGCRPLGYLTLQVNNFPAFAQAIEIISPRLHHFLPFGKMLGVVVGSTHCVAFAMGKLALDRITIPTLLVQ